MQSMEAYPRAAMERAMKVQDVMLQAMAKKIMNRLFSHLTQCVLRDYTKRPFTKAVRKSILAAKSFLGKNVHESSVT
jgi:hypothetical protein